MKYRRVVLTSSTYGTSRTFPRRAGKAFCGIGVISAPQEHEVPLLLQKPLPQENVVNPSDTLGLARLRLRARRLERIPFEGKGYLSRLQILRNTFHSGELEGGGRDDADGRTGFCR